VSRSEEHPSVEKARKAIAAGSSGSGGGGGDDEEGGRSSSGGSSATKRIVKLERLRSECGTVMSVKSSGDVEVRWDSSGKSEVCRFGKTVASKLVVDGGDGGGGDAGGDGGGGGEGGGEGGAGAEATEEGGAEGEVSDSEDSLDGQEGEGEEPPLGISRTLSGSSLNEQPQQFAAAGEEGEEEGEEEEEEEEGKEEEEEQASVPGTPAPAVARSNNNNNNNAPLQEIKKVYDLVVVDEDAAGIVYWKGVTPPTPDESGASKALPWSTLKLHVNNKTTVGFAAAQGGENQWIKVNGATRIPHDQWTHVAVVQNSERCFLYVNGEIDGEHEIPSSMSDTSSRKSKDFVVESPHPYNNNSDETYSVAVDGAVGYTVTFDSKSITEKTFDFVRFWKDSSKTEWWGEEKYVASLALPCAPLRSLALPCAPLRSLCAAD
jgi:hypothetical protein